MSEPRTLVLLRHGRTAYNAEARIQGQADVDLDETGHDQAVRAALALADLQPAVLWSSDLARARSTAAYLAKETGLEPVHDERLREFHLGEREQLTHAEYAERAPAEYARFRLGDFDAVAGGERTADVAARMSASLHGLLAATPAGGTAVAVSHGAAIRAGVVAVLGWPPAALHALHGLDNCGWVVLEGHPDDPAGPGALRLRAYNRR